MSRQRPPDSSLSASRDPKEVVNLDEADSARHLPGEWSDGVQASIARSVTENSSEGTPGSDSNVPPERLADTARAHATDTTTGDTPPPGTSPEVIWSRLQAELRDFAEQEAATWGGVDECLLARYLADECTDEEERRIEQATKDYPAVRECLELVQEVMMDAEIDTLPLVDLEVPTVRPNNSKPDIPPFLQAKPVTRTIASATTQSATPRAAISNWITAAALLVAFGSISLHFAEKMNFGAELPPLVASNSTMREVAELEARLASHEKQLIEASKLSREMQAARNELQNLLDERLAAVVATAPASKPRPDDKPDPTSATTETGREPVLVAESVRAEPLRSLRTIANRRDPILVADSLRGQKIAETPNACLPYYSESVTHTVMKPVDVQPAQAPAPTVANSDRLSAFRLEPVPVATSDSLPLLPLSELVDAAQTWQKKKSPLLPLVAKALRKQFGDSSQWPPEFIDALVKHEKDPSKVAELVLTGKIDLKGAAELSSVVEGFMNSGKPELRAAAMALSGEIEAKSTIELPAVMEGLKSQNPLERWAAVAALSQSWKSCGVFVVDPDFVPSTTHSAPNPADRLRPVPDQRFATANFMQRERPTLTVFKPAFKNPASTLVNSELPDNRQLLVDRQPEEEPVRRRVAQTFAAPANATQPYDEPSVSPPPPNQPAGLAGQHYLNAKANTLVNELTKRLEDEDELVRRTTLHVIADFGPAALPSRESLDRLLRSNAGAETKRWAAYAIGRIGPSARDSIAALNERLIEKDDDSVRIAVCFAVSQLAGGPQPLDEVTREALSRSLSLLMSADTDPQVRRWAAFAFNALNRPQQAQGEAPPPHDAPGTTSIQTPSNLKQTVKS